MPIIEVNNVTKEYRLGHMNSLKQTALNMFSRLRGKAAPKQEPFKALDDIDFKVEEGEVLGIIGTNGAGKSTLLKLLARVSVPTKGDIKVGGSVAPLIEVGAGLVGDLTGRENIYLNGSILGLSIASIKKKFDEIVEFAELEEFIDTPIKRYSSGMMIRLGFSIATSVDSDILIIDEVLAVGDLAFQRKCFDRMEELIKRQGKTVLLVSHNIRQVERLCSRVILLGHGKVLVDDKPECVCNLYYKRSDERIKNSIQKATLDSNKNHRMTGEVELLDVSLVDKNKRPLNEIKYNSDVEVSLKIKTNIELIKPIFALGVHTTDFLYLATHRSLEQIKTDSLSPGLHNLSCKINSFPILPGAYSLRMSISSGEICSTIFYAENILHFTVVSERLRRSEIASEGFFQFNANWTITS
ncbi:MAG: ABC transporter ATP-binding protein [Deltaproteobacteria bacterium]|nr:ABC transporter ATP-binding protein [Deltaproteobacteria bacterium]